MAYNLVSLIRILEQILHHDQECWVLDHHQKTQLLSLLEKASSLKTTLENSCAHRNRRLEALTRDASHEAEDMIERHMVDHVLFQPRGTTFTFSMSQHLESANARLEEITNGSWPEPEPQIPPPPAPTRPDPPSSRKLPVGLDDDLLQLKDLLTREPKKKLQIIPIVGAGGIGKTTLARNLYNDKLIDEHFDVRAWVTVSNDYDLSVIESTILRCITEDDTYYLHYRFKHRLSVQLHKHLYGRRFLIVLDDVWSSGALFDIKRNFPDNGNGSKVVVTTRRSHICESSGQHMMRYLGGPDSWKLLRRKVFAGEEDQYCPPALERIGREIAAHCGGLPLAIDVIGGILSEAPATEESWEIVENDARSMLTEDMDFYRILSLSYDRLPDHLKPCFLYMGAFPEKYEVPASKLIRLWKAEGFIKDETVGLSYLEALVGRNLLEEKDGTRGNAKSYGIHDCLRELCVELANQERFLYVRGRGKVLEGRWRRVSGDPSCFLHDLDEWFVRSFLCNALEASDALPVVFGLKFLRVLDLFGIELHHFPEGVTQLVNLRYLAFCCNQDHIPCNISKLWNLQTLIVRSNRGYIDIPSEIWRMKELVHVRLKNTVIWFKPEENETAVLVHEKLQTISAANLYGLIQSGFLVGVSNIVKLGICFDFSPEFVDLSHLHKLETLKVWGNYQTEVKFPVGIRKLTLKECLLTATFMSSVGSLPSLEVLKIQKCDFQENKTEQLAEEEFCSLQFLLLDNLGLVGRPAGWTDFPEPRCLVIRRCPRLEEIPLDTERINRLEVIDLDVGSSSAEKSAVRIMEEQAEYGNIVQVHITSSNGRVSLSTRDVEGDIVPDYHGLF